VTSLHWRIIALLAWLTFFFNIERFTTFGQDAIQLNAGVYIIGAVAALLPMVPFAQHRSLLSLSVVVTLLYAVVVMLSPTPVLGGTFTYITFSSYILVIMTLIFSYRVGQATLEFRKAIETVTFSDANGRLRDLHEMQSLVDTEMVRSRRFERPLSLVMLQADASSLNMTMHKLVQEVQRSMMQRYVLSTMARVLSRCLRRNDLVIEDKKPGRLLLLAPETNEYDAMKMGNRISRLVQDRLGISAHFSIAAFPQHALTFEELLHVAEQRLQADPSVANDQELDGEILELSTRAKVTHD
jgi:GGDEF domain-containing protein